MTYTEKLKQLNEAAMTQTPMPLYQCHKKVWALKIGAIEVVHPTIEELEEIIRSADSEKDLLAAIVTPADAMFGPFGVTQEYFRKHNPEAGGYYVVYSDGYKSYSPAKPFEEGYIASIAMHPAMKTNCRVIELPKAPEDLIRQAELGRARLGDLLLGLLIGLAIGVCGTYLAIALKGSL